MPVNEDLTRLLAIDKYNVVGIEEEDEEQVTLFLEPDWRHPICPECGQSCMFIHSREERRVRHLDVFHRRCWLKFEVRYIRCPYCGLHAEAHWVAEPRKRTTQAFRRYVGGLCLHLPISAVAEYVDLSEHTVRTIDKEYLEENYPEAEFSKLRRLAIDEIAYHKGHKYLTVVADYDTGEVIWTGKGKGAGTLGAFFRRIGPKVCRQIVAVSMDMSSSYLKAIRKYCPKAREVFDRFHVAKHLNDAVNDVRKLTMARASDERKSVVKGKRFVLLKRFERLGDEQINQLDELLNLNDDLTVTYLMKEQFTEFWSYGNAGAAAKFLDAWVAEALATGIKPLKKVARMIRRHRYGLLAFHVHHMSNGPLEGINNKINVLRRSRYGFRDLVYFGLKIRQLSIERSPRQTRRKARSAA